MLINVTLSYLGVAFLPVFARVKKELGDAEAWRLTSVLINYVVLFDIVIIAILFFQGNALYKLFLPGFSPERISMVFKMFKIMSLAYIFQSVATLLTYVCHYKEKFIKAAIAPQFISLTVIASVLTLKSSIGIYSLAVGFILGYFLQAALLWSEIGRNYSLSFSYRRSRSVGEVIRASSPLIAAGYISSGQSLFERYFASSLLTGSIATLGFAAQFLKVFNIATTGISTVLFPKISKATADKNIKLVGELLTDSVATLFLYLIPLAAFLGVYRYEVVGALFERGRFTHLMTIGVADTLVFYLGYLMFDGVGTVLGRGFYVRKKNLVPAILNASGTFLYIGLALVFVQWLGVRGIALAMSVLFTATNTIMVIFLARLYPSFRMWHIIRSCLKYLSLSVGMLIVIHQFFPSFRWYWANLLLGAPLFGVSYMLVLLVFRDVHLDTAIEHFGLRKWTDWIPRVPAR
jgi:putative peptidoglycan lipid II flippase